MSNITYSIDFILYSWTSLSEGMIPTFLNYIMCIMCIGGLKMHSVLRRDPNNDVFVILEGSSTVVNYVYSKWWLEIGKTKSFQQSTHLLFIMNINEMYLDEIYPILSSWSHIIFTAGTSLVPGSSELWIPPSQFYSAGLRMSIWQRLK